MKNQKVKWEVLSNKSIKVSKSIKGIKSRTGRTGRASSASRESRTSMASRTGRASTEEIVDVLLKNRGLKTKKQREEFFKPTHPEKLSVKSLGISEAHLKKAIDRIKKAIKKKEQIIIYGDYDADGICATAILWETLYSLTNKVRPYIPNRFEEGYGINAVSVEKIKIQNPNVKLIITVDNGIIAHEAIVKANDLGIDVIITDHHQKEKKLPKALAIIHTDKISGSGVAWIFARELVKKIQNPRLRGQAKSKIQVKNGLELAAIGTIADQMPLIGPNRSFAKYGLEALDNTKRKGLLALFQEAGLKTFKGSTLKGGQVTTYEVNFIIAPRINAMGRLEHAIDSLRLLCTKSPKKAKELAKNLGKTNRERQRIVEEVVLHAREVAEKKTWDGAIVLSHETYHEGVIGLAASKLVEEFGRPSIVISKGKNISKASARSITGFNIIESIKSLDRHILGGGGHPMAAGFSIDTEKIETFKKEYEKLTKQLLTNEVLTKSIKIDMEIQFNRLNKTLMREIENFEPFGIGNYAPVFMTGKTKVIDARTVGSDNKHLKLTLEKDGSHFSAIAFNKGEYYQRLLSSGLIDVVYNLDRNTWNGNDSLQLKIKDLRVN